MRLCKLCVLVVFPYRMWWRGWPASLWSAPPVTWCPPCTPAPRTPTLTSGPCVRPPRLACETSRLRCSPLRRPSSASWSLRVRNLSSLIIVVIDYLMKETWRKCFKVITNIVKLWGWFCADPLSHTDCSETGSASQDAYSSWSFTQFLCSLDITQVPVINTWCNSLEISDWFFDIVVSCSCPRQWPGL